MFSLSLFLFGFVIVFRCLSLSFVVYVFPLCVFYLPGSPVEVVLPPVVVVVPPVVLVVPSVVVVVPPVMVVVPAIVVAVPPVEVVVPLSIYILRLFLYLSFVLFSIMRVCVYLCCCFPSFCLSFVLSLSRCAPLLCVLSLSFVSFVL